MKESLKQIALGLWSAVCIAAMLAKDWWLAANKKQRIIVGGVLAGVLLLFSTCVLAEPTDDSNWSIVQVKNSMQRLVCYQETGVPLTGHVTICLIGMQTPLGEDAILFNGMQAFCAITDYDAVVEVPVWDCANTHKEMSDKLRGI